VSLGSCSGGRVLPIPCQAREEGAGVSAPPLGPFPTGQETQPHSGSTRPPCAQGQLRLYSRLRPRWWPSRGAYRVLRRF